MFSVGPASTYFEKTWVNINGEITPAKEAKISIFDRGFLFGDSVYEATRTYHQIPHLLPEHLKRLHLSAKRLQMEITLGDELLTREIMRLLEKVVAPQVTLRIIVTRGIGELSLDPSTTFTGNNFIIIAKGKEENPKDWYEKGVTLAISSEQREKGDLGPGIKSGNYIHNMKALQEAKKKGAYDAIMLGSKGEITEGTTFNIWMVKNQTIFTPPLNTGILEGITRQKLFEICQKNKIALQEKVFYVEDLLSADEVFLTSSGRELVPVTKIENQTIKEGKPGSLSKELLSLYRKSIPNKN